MRITIDPGVSALGYALWTEDGHFVRAGNLYPEPYEEWTDRAQSLVKKLRLIALSQKISTAYIEYPALHSSEGGAVVARSGALLKLTFMVGMLYAMFRVSKLVTVAEWKGSLPKEVVEDRVRKILGEKIKDCKAHSIDALGIGLYVTGRF